MPQALKAEHVTLVDLPDTTGDVQAVMVGSVTEAAKYLRQQMAVTAAGLTGALNVWRDDNGEWRCEFMRNLVTVERANFAHVAAVVQWLKEWWPSVGRRSS